MTGRNAVRGLLAAIVAAVLLAGIGTGAAQAAAPGWKVLAAVAPTNLPPATSEVQEVAVDASGGTFTLSFEGQATGPLAFNSSSSSIQAALNDLPAVSGAGGQVSVTGGPGNPGAESPYFVHFEGSLLGRDVSVLTAESGGLQGGAGTATVTTTVQGQPKFEGGSLSVLVTNVGGAASGFNPMVQVSIGPLPAGVETRAASEGGWNCPAAGEASVLTCTHLLPIAGGANAARLRIPLTVDGSSAPQDSDLPVTVSGGGAAKADTEQVPLVVSSKEAAPGIAAFWAGAFDSDGEPELRAGGHPASASTAFWLNSVLAPDGKHIVPAGSARNVDVGLPPGFLGDAMVTEKRCPQEALSGNESPVEPQSPSCQAAASRVGFLFPVFGRYDNPNGTPPPSPIFNDVPALGAPAEFTASVVTFARISLLGSIRSDEDYGVAIGTSNLSAFFNLFGSVASLEGVPTSTLGRSFLRNPTDCSLQREEAAGGRGPLTTISMNSWQNPDPNAIEDEAAAPQPVVVGCDALTQAWVGNGPEPGEERPTLSFQPGTSQAATGTGATAHIHIPQRGLTDPNRLGTSDLRKTVVVLPRGLDLNPAAANGLQACSEGQVGFLGSGFSMPTPIRFTEAPVTCPEGSKLGTVQINSPLLESELEGTIYLAAQEENPFHSLLALYLVVDDARTGVKLKLAGEVRPDPSTGQLTATFDDNPQLPFEDLELHFRGGGPRSELSTPAVCGSYKTTGSLTPWSAESESPAEAAQIEEGGFRVDAGPGGGSCATSEASLPFAPSFEAGTTSTQAGAYAPLVIKLARKDGEQELTRLDFTLPPGLTAKLAGLSYCADSAIAAAAAKSGKAELANPSCPASSELGSVDTAAGVGSEPIHVGGHVYFAGPYEGAPLSAVVITPAVAGPFDLGDVVVRTPLFVNPETAQITARSDEIPHILRGIPLQLRSVEIKVDRQAYTLNPTSCEPMVASSSLTGLNGAKAMPSSRFQVGNCQALRFKPQLKISVLGKTNRNAKPRLKAVLTTKPGEAGIRRAQVNLPHSEFLEQNHIKTVCTRVQFAEGDGNGSACPKGSIYGRAKAWTPLLDHPLEGFVYLRSNGGERKLPDVVAALDGQIDIALWGKVDSGPNRGIRNTFEVVPDAPVTRFVLEMNGGKKGLLVNSENLCAPRAKRRALVRLTGQNNKLRSFKPLVANSCKKNGRGKKEPGKAPVRHKG
jgi:hypothetical protein